MTQRPRGEGLQGVEIIDGDSVVGHDAKRGWVASLGEGDGTRVADETVVFALGEFPQVGVAVDDGVEAAWGQRLLIIYVTMGEQDAAPLIDKDRVGREDGEMEEHLVDLRVAVASHGHNVGGHGVERLGNAGGVEPLGHPIARAIVEDVAHEEQHVALLGTIEVERSLQAGQRSVDVGKEHVSHRLR